MPIVRYPFLHAASRTLEGIIIELWTRRMGRVHSTVVEWSTPRVGACPHSSPLPEYRERETNGARHIGTELRKENHMADAFKNIGKVQFEGPKSKNPLAFKHYNPDEVDRGKDDARITCGSRSSTGTRCVGRARICLAGRRRSGRGMTARAAIELAKARVPVFFEFCGEAGRAVLCVSRSRRGAARADAARIERVSRYDREAAQGAAAARRASSCSGARRSSSCIRATCTARRRVAECGCVRLCRGAGEESAGSDARARRRRLYFLGRARGLLDAAGTPT